MSQAPRTTRWPRGIDTAALLLCAAESTPTTPGLAELRAAFAAEPLKEHIMASKTISVRIFLHDQLVDTRSFDQDVIKLGRLGSSHLRLDDEAVGRMHAVIELGQDGNARLVDLGTSSGTRLNGALIDRSHALHSGDKLELGPYRIEVSIADPMPAAERAAATSLEHAAITAPQPAASAAPLAIDLSKVEDASEQVAEVVATYGRSILDVAHVGQARSRRASAIPLLGLGGVLFAGGLGLFSYEVAQPWAEHTAAVAEAQSHHRELPQAPGLGTGSLGLLLAFMGLVPFLAGSLRLREQPLAAYTIGEGSEASFKVSGSSLPNPAATPLVQRLTGGDSGGYALAFTPSMGGEVELGGERMSLAELVSAGRAAVHEGAYLYPLPTGAKARVDHGDIRFNVNLVNRGAVVAGRGQVDWTFWGYFGGTATIATAFYMLMRAMPEDALAMQLEDDQAAAKFASYFHQADNKPADEPVETELADNSNAPSGGQSAARAPGTEGRMGDKRSRDSAKSYAMSGPKDATPRMARDFDVDAAARNAGILGILSQQDTHFLASVNGGAFAVGNNDEDAWGNMVGTEIGAAYGTGGLGLVGHGRGGGDGSGLIGMGGTGLLGHGPGTGGTSYGPKGGTGTGFGPRAPKTPVAGIGKDVVVGDIDRDLIRRVVRAHLNEVRGCYNSGLTRNPNLDGRITIQFSIVGTGKVGSALVQENTTKDSAVGDCIAKAVKRWSFPRVRNGGTAMVSYPFRLTAH